MSGKLLPWPAKPKRPRKTRDQRLAEALGMTDAEFRRFLMRAINLPKVGKT